MALSLLRVCVFSMSVHPDNTSEAAGTNSGEVKSLLGKRSEYWNTALLETTGKSEHA